MEDYNSYTGPDNTPSPNEEQIIRSESGEIRMSVDPVIRQQEEEIQLELERMTLQGVELREITQVYNPNEIINTFMSETTPQVRPQVLSTVPRRPNPSEIEGIELIDDTTSETTVEFIPTEEAGTRRTRRRPIRDQRDPILVPLSESMHYQEYLVRLENSYEVTGYLRDRIYRETGVQVNDEQTLAEMRLLNRFRPPVIQEYRHGKYIEECQKQAKKFTEIVKRRLSWQQILPCLQKRCSQRHFEMLSKIGEVLEQVYPNEWDIQVEFQAEYKTHTNPYGRTGNLEWSVLDTFTVKDAKFFIHFPEINLRNSKGMEYLLKDMYIKQTINLQTGAGVYLSDDMSGARTTITKAEYNGGYMHSHLPTSIQNGTKISFCDFCTGTGTQTINQVLALVNVDWDMDIFALYLNQIKTYLEWESLEGGPHANMEKYVLPKNYDIGEVSVSMCMSVFDSIKRLMRKYGVLPTFKWAFKNGKYVIIEPDEVSTFIRMMSERHGIDIPMIWYFKDSAGVLYVDNRGTSDKPMPYVMPTLFFKQQYIPLVVMEQNTELRNNNQTKYVHTNIRDYVKSRLEYYANKEVVKKTYIDNVSNTDNS